MGRSTTRQLRPDLASKFVSMSELARQFNINYQTLYNRFVLQGKFTPTRFAGHCYFNRQDLPALIAIGTAPIYKSGPRK